MEAKLPEEWNGKKSEKTDQQLKVNPISYQIGKQRQQASRHAPEILYHDSGERSVLGGEQFTRQDKPLQYDSLKKTQTHALHYNKTTPSIDQKEKERKKACFTSFVRQPRQLTGFPVTVIWLLVQC